MPAPSTPLARSIILGTKGKDVLAVKRALSRAGYMEWTSFTDVAGQFCIQSIHNFQHDVGLAPAGYGERTHAKLLATRKKGSKTEWAWDSLSINLMHEEYVLLHTTPEQRIRSAIIQAIKNLYAHRASIAYEQNRPYPLYTLGGPIPKYLDCSGTFSTCHYAAGAKNPNVYDGARMPWNGEGFTGTLLAGGAKTTRDKLKPGDAVMYGFTTDPSPAFPYGSPTHIAMWAGDGTVYSMGHYPMGHYNFDYGQQINCYVTYNVVP
jgi:hypothetical protein